jgi:4-diphosphocytidyl-2-C-methyl-D-erythritol kinase
MSDPNRLGLVVRIAPAKLNLTLAIIGRRPDGYHAIHSVMAPLELADRLSLALAAGPIDTLHVVSDRDLSDLGPAADNLVLRAIGATRSALGGALPTPPVAARLDKRIPVAAGLGGGSSDAAAALDGVLELWGAPGDAVLSSDERRRLAARLGSDVPFFQAGGLALVEGRGEQVSPLDGAIKGAPPGILLVTPALAVSSGAVFAALAAAAGAPNGATRTSSEHLAGELQRGLTGQALHDRAGVLAAANDLLPASAVVVPGLVSLRRALTRLTGRPVGLSGSGPTLWILYPGPAEAQAAADAVNSALEAGVLVPPGDGPPFVAATTIAALSGAPGSVSRV